MGMHLSLFLILTTLFCAHAHSDEKKVALLFLTRKELNHPNLWKTLLETSEHKQKFTLYIHSKEPMEDPYFKDFRIKEIVPTSWSRHILAWQALLKEALQDRNNYKFVFLSESCIPLHTLDTIYTRVTQDDKTYMSFCRPWWPPNHERTVVDLPRKHRWANQEWVILNQREALCLAADHFIIKMISNYPNDQESWPSSTLSVLNLLNQVNNTITTYVNWNLPSNGGSSPYEFLDATPMNLAFLDEAKKTGFLFARKISKHFPEQALFSLIKGPQGQ